MLLVREAKDQQEELGIFLVQTEMVMMVAVVGARLRLALGQLEGQLVEAAAVEERTVHLLLEELTETGLLEEQMAEVEALALVVRLARTQQAL